MLHTAVVGNPFLDMFFIPRNPRRPEIFQVMEGVTLV